MDISTHLSLIPPEIEILQQENIYRGLKLFEKKLTYPNNLQFFQTETEEYFIDYIPGKLNQLVVTFENAEKPDLPRPDGLRYAWGSLFLHNKGYCVLGVKPKKVDWYRGTCLHNFFRSTEFQAFSSSFCKVFFYGSSMGGFGAMVFSDSVPNSTVIVFNPQTTLIPEQTEWDKRYPQGTSQDWNGDFNDAKKFSIKASRVYIAYDPFCAEDNKHISRISETSDNLVLLKMPLVGHVMMMWLQQAGVLQTFIEGAFSENLTAHDCNILARKRKEIARYYHMMGIKAINQTIVFRCISKLFELSILPENLQEIIKELVAKISEKDNVKLNEVPIRNKDDLSRPQISRAYFVLIKKASDLGLINESLDYSLKLLRSGAYNAYILTNISECLYKLSKYHNALLYIDEAIICDSSIANLHRLKSRIHLSLGNFSDALTCATQSLEIEPNNKNGIIDLLNAAIKTENTNYIKFSAERLVCEFKLPNYKKYIE